MAEDNLTSEQRAIIEHPSGCHARVLAVAGSGKTTTMAYRIKHLVMNLKASPSSIRVLMFNRLARQEFQERLTNKVGLRVELQPRVDTFHSFAYQFIGDMVTRGYLPGGLNLWMDDKSELARWTLHEAINNLERSRRIQPDTVDPDEATQAIGLWKGSLIPPDRAGYRRNCPIPLVYSEFERLRMQKRALTYDDFIPLAVAVMEREQSIRQDYCGRADYVIVDEYQDVNYGQQRLVELLAGRRADVMVVGDDDQTIYEWRGARPNYILREFRTVFDNKPHVDYNLSQSFRFGPVIAQCAYNTIRFNATRVEKPLMARFIGKPAEFQIIKHKLEQETDATREMADQVVILVKHHRVPPSRIAVLCRMFAQLTGIQAEFMARHIPFHVLGQRPFYERREVSCLLDYIRLAVALDLPVTAQAETWLLSIANMPSRMLRRADLSDAMKTAEASGGSTRQALCRMSAHRASLLSAPQRERVAVFVELLDSIKATAASCPSPMAGELLASIVSSAAYLSHFDNYYGKGEESYDRKRAVGSFIDYANSTGLTPLEFVKHIDGLDSTRGAPVDQQIRMTTVFRTKGLEYDYVFVPECTEGFMPSLHQTAVSIFDTAGEVEEPEPSEAIENERRLFYVAVTRAKEGVYIGVPDSATSTRSGANPNHSSRFLDEIQLPPTLALMSSLQQIAAGQKEAKASLLTAASKFGGLKSLGQNLFRYLGIVGDEILTGRVASLVAASEEIPFRYSFAYKTRNLDRGNQQPTEIPSLHKAWGDVD